MTTRGTWPRQPATQRRNAGDGLWRRSRQRILAQAGLLAADPLRQQAFWRHYNLAWKQRSRPIGELARNILASPLLRNAGRLGPIRREWMGILPPELADTCEPMGLHGERLTIWVCDASVRFILQRGVGAQLLAALQATRAGRGVRELAYCLGARPAADAVND